MNRWLAARLPMSTVGCDPARTTMLVMASPVGVMALTFANRYDGESGAIAMAILWSMVISVLIVPMLIAI